MEHTKKQKPDYRALLISVILSLMMLVGGLYWIETLSLHMLGKRLFFPLLRLMLFIVAGLVAGQLIETTGWTRYLAFIASPFFRFGKLGKHCGAAFTTAFISGVAANAMLLDFYKEGIITRKKLFLSNFLNQFPAFFLHLPTTFFIVAPLTGRAGILYFILTFTATLVRTFLLLFYGHFSLKPEQEAIDTIGEKRPKSKKQGFTEGLKNKLPARALNIAVYVLPVYVAVFMLNSLGVFDALNKLMSKYIVTVFVPIESLSVVILSFGAEFTSGFAAAGALLDAGILNVKQTVIALIAGNILAFPLRALRHQLPRYMGIYSPKMGTQLLLTGQALRVVSLVAVTALYYLFF